MCSLLLNLRWTLLASQRHVCVCVCLCANLFWHEVSSAKLNLEVTCLSDFLITIMECDRVSCAVPGKRSGPQLVKTHFKDLWPAPSLDLRTDWLTDWLGIFWVCIGFHTRLCSSVKCRTRWPKEGKTKSRTRTLISLSLTYHTVFEGQRSSLVFSTKLMILHQLRKVTCFWKAILIWTASFFLKCFFSQTVNKVNRAGKTCAV